MKDYSDPLKQRNSVLMARDADKLMEEAAQLRRVADRLDRIAAYLRKDYRYVDPSISNLRIVEVAAEVVGETYQVRIEQIFSKQRTQRIVAVRQVLSYMLVVGGMSSVAAGLALRRDHATVLHHVKIVRDRIAKEPQFRTMIQGLMDEVTLRAATASAQSLPIANRNGVAA